MTVKSIVYHAYPIVSCPLDGGGVILKETTPIRMEMFQHSWIKVISSKNFVLICSDALLKEAKFTQTRLTFQLPRHHSVDKHYYAYSCKHWQTHMTHKWIQNVLNAQPYCFWTEQTDNHPNDIQQKKCFNKWNMLTH